MRLQQCGLHPQGVWCDLCTPRLTVRCGPCWRSRPDLVTPPHMAEVTRAPLLLYRKGADVGVASTQPPGEPPGWLVWQVERLAVAAVRLRGDGHLVEGFGARERVLLPKPARIVDEAVELDCRHGHRRRVPVAVVRAVCDAAHLAGDRAVRV